MLLNQQFQFNSPRSQGQIAIYNTYRSKAIDERNRLNLARWTAYGLPRWQLQTVEVKKP